MAVTARYKHASRQYLASPYKYPGGPELWYWSPDPSRAHHFASRAEAKAMLRALRDGSRAYRLSDFTFEKV